MKELSTEEKIQKLVIKTKKELNKKIEQRMDELKTDDNSHQEAYQWLGIDEEEGKKIDEYQNKGRLLYKSLGSTLEKVVQMCFEGKYENIEKNKKIPNTVSSSPKKVEIDCLLNKKEAIEIKWRDATTDGDHVKKEKTRIEVIKKAGYKPVRIMLYDPIREEAISIQKKIKKEYDEAGGEYYSGKAAWNYIKEKTDTDLKKVLPLMLTVVAFQT